MQLLVLCYLSQPHFSLLLKTLINSLQRLQVLWRRNPQISRLGETVVISHFLRFIFLEALICHGRALGRHHIALDGGSVENAALALRIVQHLSVGAPIKLLVAVKILYLNFAVCCFSSLRFQRRGKYIIKCRLVIIKKSHPRQLLLRKLATFLELFKSVYQLNLLLFRLLLYNGSRDLQLLLFLLDLLSFHHIVLKFLLYFTFVIILRLLNPQEVFHFVFSSQELYFALQGVLPFFISMRFRQILLLLISHLFELTNAFLLNFGVQLLDVFQLQLLLLMVLLF